MPNPPFVDYDAFQVGPIVQPVVRQTTNSTLYDADRALYYALDFWSYVVATYPGARIIQAAQAANVRDPAGAPVAQAVAQAYPFDPLPTFLENQVQFPALFAFRTRGQTEQWTVGREHDVCGFTLMYVLPPLDAAGYEVLYPLLKAVYDAIRKKTTDAWDPGYTPPGGTVGQQFTISALGCIEEIGFGPPSDKRVVSVETGFAYGKLPGTGDNWFPALIMQGFITEADELNPTAGGMSAFAGADVSANLRADDGTSVPDVVQIGTQEAPVVSSLSVATGTSAGGTSVTITGQLFLAGPPQVYFGLPSDPQYATAVTFNSSTSLTVTTPAMQGAGTVDVTVVNRDSQSGTLPQSFTFT